MVSGLRRILAQEGDAHPVGALLGVIASAVVDDADIDAELMEIFLEEALAEIELGEARKRLPASRCILDRAPHACSAAAMR